MKRLWMILTKIVNQLAFCLWYFRLVYKWFYFIYKLSYGLGIIGYIVMMLTFVGFNLLFNQQPTVWMDVGFMFIFYGLYFGVLGRDLSEICADKMAANIGVSESTSRKIHFSIANQLKNSQIKM